MTLKEQRHNHSAPSDHVAARTEPVTFRSQFKLLREELGITQDLMGKRIGVSGSMVAYLEGRDLARQPILLAEKLPKYLTKLGTPRAREVLRLFKQETALLPTLTGSSPQRESVVHPSDQIFVPLKIVDESRLEPATEPQERELRLTIKSKDATVDRVIRTQDDVTKVAALLSALL